MFGDHLSGIYEKAFDPAISGATDRGAIEDLEADYLDEVTRGIIDYLRLEVPHRD